MFEEPSAVANWLNAAFADFDNALLSILHEFAVATDNGFTFLFNGISLLVENGFFILTLGIIFLFFKTTRKVGICMIGAVACGALITNVMLKNLIARPRPFEDIEGMYHFWWVFVGSVQETSFAFPSGHTTAAMACATSIFLCCKKRYSWTAFLLVIAMGMSRNYLMVHYPSDIIGGIVAGAIGGVIAYMATNALYRYCESQEDSKLSRLVLTFSVIQRKAPEPRQV